MDNQTNNSMSLSLAQVKAVYFIGAGGIGMSALERYFLARGLAVGGYDKTPTELSARLEKEGVWMHYEDNIEEVPERFKNRETTLVVYTPAVPFNHSELMWFRREGFEIQKRAQVLGTLTREMKGLCVAGTHGKTTTTAMLAHILHQSKVGGNAFLGGITKNYGTNYMVNHESPYVVIEADEFDRSFHHLRPYATVITATDADHLDIYGTEDAYLDSFRKYTELIQEDGVLVMHTGLKMKQNAGKGVRVYTYSREEGDFHAENVSVGGGRVVFDYVSPLGNIAGVELGVPVSINIENGIAAMALAQVAGVEADEIREAMRTFSGVDRRFDFRIKNDRIVLLSDYAHHPEEIRQSILSVREVFDGRKISAIFQPHLYSRTRDFFPQFAESLSLLDEVILIDIYPAREAPIPGVTSQIIYDNLRPGIEKRMVHKEDLANLARHHDFDVLMVLGAGDVDNYTPQIAEVLAKKYGVEE